MTWISTVQTPGRFDVMVTGPKVGIVMAWLRWTTNVLACEKPRACCPVLGCTSRRRADPYQRRFPRVRHGSHWLAAQRSGHVAPASWPEGTLPVHMHLDVAVDDLQAGVERAIELGAARKTISQLSIGGGSCARPVVTSSACHTTSRTTCQRPSNGGEVRRAGGCTADTHIRSQLGWMKWSSRGVVPSQSSTAM